MRVYIADDNREFTKLMRVVAEREGWMVTTCADGRELAAELDLEDGPALLFVDINMPEMDGIEVIDEIKTIKRRMRIRFVTGGVDSSAVAARMIAKARDLDVGGVLRKPLSMKDVKAILQIEAGLLYPAR